MPHDRFETKKCPAGRVLFNWKVWPWRPTFFKNKVGRQIITGKTSQGHLKKTPLQGKGVVGKVVEMRGIEPLTSALRTLRSPN
jgi:hypothetical protein